MSLFSADKLDSLEQLLDNNDDFKRSKYYVSYINHVLSNDKIDSSAKYFDDIDSLLLSENVHKDFQYSVGLLFYTYGKKHFHYKYLKNAFSIFVDKQDSLLAQNTLLKIGETHLKNRDYDNAINTFSAIKEQYLPNSNKEYKYKVYSYIAQIYWKVKKYKNSIEYLNLCKQIASQDQNLDLLIKVKNNIGLIQMANHEYNDSRINFTEALDIARQIKDTTCLIKSYYNKAYSYYKQKKYSDALEQIKIAEDISDKHEFFFKSYVHYILGQIYFALNKNELAVLYLHKAINTCDSHEHFIKIYTTLYKIYKPTDTKKALYYLEKYKLYADSVNTDIASLQDNKIKNFIDYIQTKHDNKKLKSESSLLKQIDIFLMALSLVGIIFTFLLYRQFRNKQLEKLVLEEKNQEIINQKNEIEIANIELTNSKEKLTAMFNNAIVGFAILNPQGKIQRVNYTWLEMFGYSEEEMTSLYYKQFIHIQDLQKTDFLYEKIAKGLLSRYHIEQRFVRKNNSSFWGDVSVSPIYNERGNVDSIIAIVVNINQRKQNELELEHKNTFLQILIDDIPNPIYYKNNQGVYQGCNKYYEKFFNLKKKNIIGKTVFDLLPNNDAIKFNKLDQDLFNNPGIKADESELTLQESSRTVIVTKASYNNVDGSIGGVIGVLNDITEIRSAEQAIIESEQKLREANASKDKFFSIIAHDLKNPLQEILLASHLIMKNQSDNKSSNLETNIKHIHSSVSHVTKLLQNLLEWSRSQSGTIRYNPEYIDLRYLANKCIKLLSTKAIKKNISLLNNISEDIICYADSNMIETVIRNLLSNALKFTPEGGTIQFDSEDNTTEAIISITDTGIGISEEDIQKIFRIDTHHSTIGLSQEEGTGLGLILCREFIDKNKGKIWVESKIDVGSSFKFVLQTINAHLAEEK